MRTEQERMELIRKKNIGNTEKRAEAQTAYPGFWMRGSLCDPDRMPGDFDAAGGKPASIYNGRFFSGRSQYF